MRALGFLMAIAGSAGLWMVPAGWMVLAMGAVGTIGVWLTAK